MKHHSIIGAWFSVIFLTFSLILNAQCPAGPGWNSQEISEGLQYYTFSGIENVSGSFVSLHRKWKDGDKLVLTLPMAVEKCSAHGGGVYFQRGPLVYSYAIPAQFNKDTVRYANMNGKYPADDNAFPCWDIQPSGPWNFAVEADASATVSGTRLRIPVRPIAWDWDKGPKGELLTPDLPAKVEPLGPSEEIELVPYGETTIRLTVFPVIQ